MTIPRPVDWRLDVCRSPARPRDGFCRGLVPAHLGLVRPAGFQPDRVLTVGVTQGGERYNDQAEIVRFWEELTARLEAQTGVEAAGGATLPPLLVQDDTPTTYETEGREPPPAGQEPIAQLIAMTHGGPAVARVDRTPRVVPDA